MRARDQIERGERTQIEKKDYDIIFVDRKSWLAIYALEGASRLVFYTLVTLEAYKQLID